MGKKDYEAWPDQMLEAQIQGTIQKLDLENNVYYKIGLKDYLRRLTKERERRKKRN